jgi:glycerophosphoryl diester phosphodiesterase
MEILRLFPMKIFLIHGELSMFTHTQTTFPKFSGLRSTDTSFVKQNRRVKKTGVLAMMAVAMMTVWAQAVPQVVAHRGGAREQDENTLSAFTNSYDKGVRGFETDIRLTKDKRIVVLHDGKLERTTTGKGRPEELTASEMAGVKSKKSGEPLPYLENLLKFLKERKNAFIQIEFKSEGYSEDAVAELARISLEMVRKSVNPKQVVFISFDIRPLKVIKALDSGHETCLLSNTANLALIQRALAIKAEWVSVNLNHVSRAFVRDAHKAGLKVAIWTIQNEVDARLAAALEPDCVVSDIPVAQLKQKAN